MSLGILVFGFKRPRPLKNLLESLRIQGSLGFVTVFLDGYLHRSEFSGECNMCRELQEVYPETKFISLNGSYGIERLMIQGLEYASSRYDKIVILEDDCFPAWNAIDLFNEALDSLKDNYFSVYGHPFGIANEEEGITRFQGWGWATTCDRCRRILPILKFLHDLDEDSYLDFVSEKLKDKRIVDSLLVTPPRDCIQVMQKQFTWDSAICLICADLQLMHQYTKDRAIFNCGMGGNRSSGHFRDENDDLRKPPYNMVTEDEVWQLFNKQLPLQIVAQKTFGLDKLDKKLSSSCSPRQRSFIELGAHDGITQSNSLFFERRGFGCLLIEPSPVAYPRLCKNRPISINENVACTYPGGPQLIELHELGLMSLADPLISTPEEHDEWYARALKFIDYEPFVYTQKATTLSSLMSQHNMPGAGIISLDVEGAELDVVRGIDFSLFEVEFMCVEVQKSQPGKNCRLIEYLENNNFEHILLNERRFTQDLLFMQKSSC